MGALWKASFDKLNLIFWCYRLEAEVRLLCLKCLSRAWSRWDGYILHLEMKYSHFTHAKFFSDNSSRQLEKPLVLNAGFTLGNDPKLYYYFWEDTVSGGLTPNFPELFRELTSLTIHDAQLSIHEPAGAETWKFKHNLHPQHIINRK